MRFRFRAWLGKLGGEDGQVLVLFVAGLTAFCGLVAMAIDVGQLVYMKSELQKTADAAAFAGAQDLPSSSEATEVANAYVGVNTSGATAAVQISGTYNPNDTIRVTAQREVKFTFLRVIGIESADVEATAVARVGTYNGGSGIVPWGLVASENKDFLGNSCFAGFDGDMPTFHQNQMCILKYGAGSNAGGDFGALALDGTGASNYRDDIANGSTKKFHKGQKVEPQTGNMQGPTGQGIDDRLDEPAPASCPGYDRDDVLKTVNGQTSILPGCEGHPRIVIIPVVDKIDNPQKSTILGFAYMFLHGEAGNGGQTAVETEFVQFVTAIPDADYTGPADGTAATAVMLIE